ncbi:TIGR02611 family protein [Pseudonocardia nematodicida]|uniref:TIGR02611 family protein n=1 Tax=Pseudonocardia nematodicida TaxID=1206997 RepID=A0ABV1KAJ7_9PSEU
MSDGRVPGTAPEQDPGPSRDRAARGWRARYHGAQRRYRGFRDGFRHRPVVDRCWRWTIGVLGTLIVIVGIIMIPYPGPGWLVVFTGLAVLSSEFESARRVLKFARRHYDRWNDWQKRQHIVLRLLLLAATGAVVLVTLWLLDVFGLVTEWLGLEVPWLDSPLEPFA